MRTQSQTLIKLPKTLNLVLGIILISTSLVFMVTEQRFHRYEHIEPLLVLVTGFLSMVIAFSTDRKIGFRINLFLGCFYLLVGVTLSILLFNELELFLNSVFGFTAQDAILNIFLGVVLLVLAYFYKNKRLYDSSPKNNEQIDNFEP